MNNIVISIDRQQILKSVLYDLVLFVGVYFIPAVAHSTSIPLYLLEPMRLMLFGLIFLTPEAKINHLIVAFTLPMVSFAVSGHPILLKSIIMSMELIINVVVLHIMLKRASMFWAVLTSVIVSKVVYYAVKFAFIYSGLLDMEIVSTSLIWQFGVVVLLSIVGGLISKFKER